MKTMNKIFDSSEFKFKNNNKRSFEYDKLARSVTRAANKAVGKKMDGIILLNKEEIETLILSFPEDHLWYIMHADELENCLNEAYDHKVGIIKLV